MTLLLFARGLLALVAGAFILVRGASLLALRLGLFDGALLLGLLMAYTVFLVRQSRAEPAATGPDEFAGELKPGTAGRWDARLPAQLGLIVAGLVLFVLGSDWLVQAAVIFARAIGLSEVIIGLTIVAAGTSLPEVAASVVASFKGERDITVGNVVGSCVVNVFGVVGLWGRRGGRRHRRRFAAAAGRGSIRSVSDARRTGGVPAGLPDRSRDRPLRGRPVPGLLHGLCGLPCDGGAAP